MTRLQKTGDEKTGDVPNYLTNFQQKPRIPSVNRQRVEVSYLVRYVPPLFVPLFFCVVPGGGLTWEEAVRAALNKSPELAQTRAEVALAEQEEPSLLANTDPQAVFGASHQDDQTPPTAPGFQAARTRTDQLRAGVTGRTLLGTEAKVFLQNTRARSPSVFKTLDPSVGSTLALEVSQPLLRYFWGRPDKARRRGFRAGVEAARAKLRFVEESLAAETFRAYVELYAAQETVLISQAGVDAARRLLASHEEKRRYGLVEESDLIQARASVEIQETRLALARNQGERARIALKRLLLLAPESEAPVVQKPSPPEIGLDTLDAALTEGLPRRGDVAAARSAVEQARWQARSVGLDTLPDLTFQGGWGYAGLGGTSARAMSALGTWDHPVKSAGLSFTVPFAFRRERLARHRAHLVLSAVEAEQTRVSHQALKDIQDAWENRRAAVETLSARRRLVELEQDKLTAEERDFRRGRSSTDMMVRFLGDLLEAKALLVRAEADEWLAAVNLVRATGQGRERLLP